MEKIRNILGLWVFEKRITDKFERASIAGIRQIGNKMANFAGDINLKEEMNALEKETTNLEGKGDRAYGKALRLLARLRPEYKKYLPKKGKGRKVPDLSELLKRKIRFTVWVGTGYKIPFRELNVAKVMNLLRAKKYSYRRKICRNKSANKVSKRLGTSRPFKFLFRGRYIARSFPALYNGIC